MIFALVKKPSVLALCAVARGGVVFLGIHVSDIPAFTDKIL
ncbi:hypothetical protein [Calothrix sp. PCC 7507]